MNFLPAYICSSRTLEPFLVFISVRTEISFLKLGMINWKLSVRYSGSPANWLDISASLARRIINTLRGWNWYLTTDLGKFKIDSSCQRLACSSKFISLLKNISEWVKITIKLAEKSRMNLDLKPALTLKSLDKTERRMIIDATRSPVFPRFITKKSLEPPQIATLRFCMSQTCAGNEVKIGRYLTRASPRLLCWYYQIKCVKLWKDQKKTRITFNRHCFLFQIYKSDKRSRSIWIILQKIKYSHWKCSLNTGRSFRWDTMMPFSK